MKKVGGLSSTSGTSKTRDTRVGTTRRNPRIEERNTLKSNPPFDKRIYTVRTVGGKGLKRGRITAQDMVGTPDSGGWGGGVLSGVHLNFLYNPSTITLSHGIQDNVIDPNYQPPDDIGIFMGPTASTLSFQLLFDRTYETWDRSLANTAQGKYGVYSDVRILYAMVGLLSPVPKPGYELIKSPMLWRPMQVRFGGSASLAYYGVINTLGITYTHWTERMVPNRCVLDIQFQIYPKPKVKK